MSILASLFRHSGVMSQYEPSFLPTILSCWLSLADCLRCLRFHPNDGGSKTLRNNWTIRRQVPEDSSVLNCSVNLMSTLTELNGDTFHGTVLFVYCVNCMDLVRKECKLLSTPASLVIERGAVTV